MFPPVLRSSWFVNRLHIAEEISDNHFKIAGGSPRMKVS